MISKNQGLTVGELTITVGILIIAGLIWSNLIGQKDSNQSFNIQSNSISINSFPRISEA